MKKTKSVCLAALTAFVLSAGVHAKDTAEADPAETEKALNILLGHADQAIPESSSCYGHYAETDKPAIRNLLATSLAYLYNGDNVIVGACAENNCTVKIMHDAGEDVSSTTIRFTLTEGRIDAASLQCIITP